ncbi:hypothetical protein MBLNU230_g3493t1 [Neophaeotheca triangularis]
MDAPIVRATAQSCVLSALSNILGQLIACWQSKVPYSIDPVELGQFVLFSFMACPPNFLWQGWLEAQFPGYTSELSPTQKERLVDDTVRGGSTATDSKNSNGSTRKRGKETDAAMTSTSTDPNPVQAKKKLNIKNTGIKFALDQTLGAGVNTVMFIAGIGLLRGKSLEAAYYAVVQQFWPLIFAGQKLWPAVSLISFTLVPVERRTLFGSLVGLGWGVFLSLASGAKKGNH